MVHAPVDIPHHGQQTDYTCGPAAMKMVLDAVAGLQLPEGHLADAMGTDPDIGTRQRMMHRFADELGLETFVRHTDTTLNEVRDAMRTGHVVIVCYWLPGEDTDHYAVVQQITPEAVVLHDPWEGPDTAMATETFEADWIGDHHVEDRRHRWMLAVRTPKT